MVILYQTTDIERAKKARDSLRRVIETPKNEYPITVKAEITGRWVNAQNEEFAIKENSPQRVILFYVYPKHMTDRGIKNTVLAEINGKTVELVPANEFSTIYLGV